MRVPRSVSVTASAASAHYEAVGINKCKLGHGSQAVGIGVLLREKGVRQGFAEALGTGGGGVSGRSAVGMWRQGFGACTSIVAVAIGFLLGLGITVITGTWLKFTGKRIDEKLLLRCGNAVGRHHGQEIGGVGVAVTSHN